jgi:microcystin-dependent protein
MPRMTSVERKAIVAPIAGLQVFDVDLKGFYYYTGNKWDCVSVPAGSVNYFANITPPDGYLECNGQAISTTTYAELFAAIGYLYGGSGASFMVPDLRGEFVRGFDNTRGIDPARVIGSYQTGTLVVGDIDGISTTNGVSIISMNPASGFAQIGCDNVVATDYPNAGFTNGGSLPSIPITSRPDVFGTARPRNVAKMPCIKF